MADAEDAPGAITVRLEDDLPQPLPDGVREVVVAHPMLSATIAPGIDERLTALRDQAAAADVALHLELPLDRDTWIHLPLWWARAQQCGVAVRPVLIDRATSDLSFERLDGDTLAAVREVLRRWCEAFDHPVDQRDALAAQLEAWEWERSERHETAVLLALPRADHPLWNVDDRDLDLLAGMLRVFESDRTRRWLTTVVQEPSWPERARRRLSLRITAYWSIGSLQEKEGLPRLASLFNDREDAANTLDADRDALAERRFESWVTSWFAELRTDTLRVARTPFLDGTMASPTTERAAEARTTVIIPSYKHEAYIEAAIRSVLLQTRADVRVLVADDASPDATVERARSVVDSRVEVQVNPENLGLGGSLERALSRVTTPYVAILNSDDLFHPERIEACEAALDDDPATRVVATGLAPIDDQARVCRREHASPMFEGVKICEWLDWFEAREPPDADALTELLHGNHLLTSSNIVARTEFLREHSRFWARQEFCLDWQIFVLAALEDGLRILPGELLGYRLHDSNTVWFDDTRRWRYFVESHQVVARVLRHRLAEVSRSGTLDPASLVALLSGPLSEHDGLDFAGVLAAFLLDQLGLTARDVGDDRTVEGLRKLEKDASLRRDAKQFMDRVEDPDSVLRLLDEVDFLRTARTRLEVATAQTQQLTGRLEGAQSEVDNLSRLWHQAEGERDAEIAEKEEAYRTLERTVEDLKATSEREREAWSKEAEARESESQVRSERDEALRAVSQAQAKAEQEIQRAGQLADQLRERTWERDALQASDQWKIGHLFLDRFKLGALYRGAKAASALARHTWQRWRLRANRAGLDLSGGKGTRRAMATACWNFPIYSQTFVYQELVQLAARGYRLRVSYSRLEPHDHLPERFGELWRFKRPLILHPSVQRRDVAHYQRRMPEKVEALLQMVCDASGLSRDHVLAHDNVQQAFSYTRLVEAYRPDYLHSYFFYDRSFMSLVAGYLLDIPRGVSCYADHEMDDYEFKLVSLHLHLCDIVIATSARIKRELLEREPGIDADKILVKPNAIDSERFPVMRREEPKDGEPWRIVCVNRIEPKKGLTHLAKAIGLLRERGIAIELHQVGEHDPDIPSSVEYHRAFLDQLEEDGMWGSIHLEGRQTLDGILRFLGMSHLFLAPFVEAESGDKDGIPTALLEAMSTGITPVATDAGSIVEVIDDGVDGVIVPQRDATALADAIEALLRDPVRRLALGEQAARKAREEFDVRVCEKRFHDRLDDVLGGHRRGALPPSPVSPR